MDADLRSAAMAWLSRRGNGHFGLGLAPVEQKKYLHLSFQKKIFFWIFPKLFYYNKKGVGGGVYAWTWKIMCDFSQKHKKNYFIPKVIFPKPKKLFYSQIFAEFFQLFYYNQGGLYVVLKNNVWFSPQELVSKNLGILCDLLLFHKSLPQPFSRFP